MPLDSHGLHRDNPHTDTHTNQHSKTITEPVRCSSPLILSRETLWKGRWKLQIGAPAASMSEAVIMFN